MSEASELVATIKKQLKGQGLTYRDVAVALHLSEASVKRLFSSSRFTVQRLIDIADLLGFTLAELTQMSLAASPKLQSLTVAQEAQLVADPKLLLVAVCVFNHWSLEAIVQTYRFTEAECLKRLLALDRMGVIDLLPGNRVRLKLTRDFDWLAHGAIQEFFRSQGQKDFLGSSFQAANETMAFQSGMLSVQGQAQMQVELRRLRARFSALHDEAVSAPFNQRSGVGLFLAMRPWEPDVFRRLRREANKPST